MDITPSTISTIEEALKITGLNKAEAAKKLGKSRAWMTKLLSSGIKTLDDDMRLKLEDLLGVRLMPYYLRDDITISPVAFRLSQYAEKDPVITQLLFNLLTVIESSSCAE